MNHTVLIRKILLLWLCISNWIHRWKKIMFISDKPRYDFVVCETVFFFIHSLIRHWNGFMWNNATLFYFFIWSISQWLFKQMPVFNANFGKNAVYSFVFGHHQNGFDTLISIQKMDLNHYYAKFEAFFFSNRIKIASKMNNIWKSFPSFELKCAWLIQIT